MQLRRKPIAAAITGGITDGLTGPIVGAAASASNDPLWTQDFSTAQLLPGATNTRSTDQYVTTDTGNLFPVPAGAIPIRGARPVRNLAASSDTPSTQNITVVSGRIYQVRIGAESAASATAACSGAFTGTLTGDATDIQTFTTGKTATTTTLTVTITGSIRKLQVQDITHRSAISTAPDEYVSTGVGTGDELITDGSFDGDGSAWTIGAGMAIAASDLTLTAPTSDGQYFEQSVELVSGASYAYEIDLTGTLSGTNYLVLRMGGTSDSVSVNSASKLTGVVAANGTGNFRVRAENSASDIVIHNISVKRCDPGQTGLDGFRYFTTALANTVDGSGVVTEATGAALSGIRLANRPGSTNLADGTHDYSAGADTITLSATGYYTLWLEGTAQVTIAAGTATITGAGSATEGNPVTINCTATGTVTLTLDSGTLDEVSGSQVIMLESGTVPTAFIPTDGSTASTDAAVIDFSGVTGFTTPNETRVVATGLNASLDPDPTDTTERTIDVDNWDGTDLSDILPHANIKSVTVYAPGERP